MHEGTLMIIKTSNLTFYEPDSRVHWILKKSWVTNIQVLEFTKEDMRAVWVQISRTTQFKDPFLTSKFSELCKGSLI